MRDLDLFIVTVGLIVIFVIGTMVYVYGYEPTKNDTEEDRILTLCINLDAYIPNCEIMYGSIDKPYGDKLQ